MQFNHSASQGTNMDQGKQLRHHAVLKSKAANGFIRQASHLESTTRKQAHAAGGSFLTQEIFTTAKKNDSHSHVPSDLCESTAIPTDIVQLKKKKRVSTESTIPNRLQESGYLGEIRFESRNGVKREFHMFADREIGIKQNAQAGWDEDIETDESCKRKAIKKCMKQLSVAIRHQREGIDPTSAYDQDYQDVEERFAHENKQIEQDYENNQSHKLLRQKQGNQMPSNSIITNNNNNNNTQLSQYSEKGIEIKNRQMQLQHQDNTLEGMSGLEVNQQLTSYKDTCIYPAQCPTIIGQMPLGQGCGSSNPIQNSNLSCSSEQDLRSQDQQQVAQNPIELETQLDLPICPYSQALLFSQEIGSFRIEHSRLFEDSNDCFNNKENGMQELIEYSQAEIEPSPDSFFLEKLQQQQLTQGTNHSAYRFCPDFPSISFSL